jgi:ABC-type sugar transport system permease subunit
MLTAVTSRLGKQKRRTLWNMSAAERRRHLQNWVLLSPQLFLFLLLTVVPLFIALPMLFTDIGNFRDTTVNYIGLDNFTRLFRDPGLADEYSSAVMRTARFAVFNIIMVYVFGLTLALLMYEVGFKGGFFTLIYMPMMISGFALGFIALMLFGKSTGVVNQALQELGLLQAPIDIKSARGTALILPILVGWQYAGWNMAIFLSGLLAIPKETIEAAVVDGASYLQRLLRVYFPQMIPTIVIVLTFALMGSFRLFDQLAALGAFAGNEEAQFLSVFLIRYGFASNRLALALVISIETFLPLMLIAGFLQYVQRRLSYEV